MSYTIQLRRDTSADWTSLNPVLAQGELGIETDTRFAKMGDGVTAWASLPYWAPSATSAGVASVNGHTGAVVLAASDVSADAAGAAASALVSAKSYTDVETARAGAAEALKANLAGGATFTGGAVTVSGNLLTARMIASSGLSGATAPSRYAGATTGGLPNTGTFAVGDFVLDNVNGGWWICTAAGSPGTWEAGGGNDYYTNQQLAAGETIFPRIGVGTGAVMATGVMNLTYWTATKTEAINNLLVIGSSTAAGATPTYAAVGVFSVDSSGNLTRVAVSASDTTLFSTTFSTRTLPTLAAWNKVAGQRYAFAILMVSAFAMPTAVGFNGTMLLANSAPRLTGIVGGQSSIPASVPVGSVSNLSSAYWGAVLP